MIGDPADQDAVVVGLADHQSRLNEMGPLEDLPDCKADVLALAR